jgi:hypothetical protein
MRIRQLVHFLIENLLFFPINTEILSFKAHTAFPTMNQECTN